MLSGYVGQWMELVQIRKQNTTTTAARTRNPTSSLLDPILRPVRVSHTQFHQTYCNRKPQEIVVKESCARSATPVGLKSPPFPVERAHLNHSALHRSNQRANCNIKLRDMRGSTQNGSSTERPRGRLPSLCHPSFLPPRFRRPEPSTDPALTP